MNEQTDVYTTFFVTSLAGTASAYFTFDAPVVSSRFDASTNAALSGGAPLTLTGLNFALDDKTMSASVGASACGTLSWTTMTMLKCSDIAPKGLETGLKQSISVTISAVVGTSITSFSFDAPVLSNVDNSNTPATAGEYITILGQNFGQVNMSPSTIIAATACGTSEWMSDTAIRCLIKQGTGIKQLGAVTVSAVVGTRISLFS
jgi:hypothetical protein